MPAACAPLQGSAPHALSKNELKTSEWGGQKSEATFHLFVNETQEEAELYWFYDGGQTKHGNIAPGSNVYIGTYTFHNWKVVGPQGQLLGVYGGASATITIRVNGCHVQVNGLPAGQLTAPTEDDVIETPEGPYRKRGEVLGMAIWAFDCVADEAVEQLKHLTSRMLENSPDWVVQRMKDAGAALALVGRHQVVTDLPPHQFMRHMQGRDLDRTSRGLGGTVPVPVTSVGEENVTMVDDWLYPCQSIFVHELGHAVLNMAMDSDAQRRLCEVFEAARQSGMYPEGAYLMTNEQEYFATGTEAWFESSIRTDVNGGINTRQALKTKDPQLADLMSMVFGDGEWRYPHDCPVPLRMLTRQDAEKRKAMYQRLDEERAARAANGQACSPAPVNRQAATPAGHDGSPARQAGADNVGGDPAAAPLLSGHTSTSRRATGSNPSGTAATAASGSSNSQAGHVSGQRRSFWDMTTHPLAACSTGRPAKVARLWRCTACGALPVCSCLGSAGTLDSLTACFPWPFWRQPKEKQ